MNNDLKGIWKEAAVVRWKEVCCWQLAGSAEEGHENAQGSWSPGRDFSPGHFRDKTNLDDNGLSPANTTKAVRRDHFEVRRCCSCGLYRHVDL
jgi:hypothetical protein